MNTGRAYLENKVFQMLQSNNNNTPHFNYKVNFERGTTTLEIYTYNSKQKALHLLHTTTGENPSICLTNTLNYLLKHGDIKKSKNPYTITWKRKGSNESHESYYYEESEDKAVEKFLYGKDPIDYDIEVKQNPIS